MYTSYDPRVAADGYVLPPSQQYQQLPQQQQHYHQRQTMDQVNNHDLLRQRQRKVTPTYPVYQDTHTPPQHFSSSLHTTPTSGSTHYSPSPTHHRSVSAPYPEPRSSPRNTPRSSAPRPLQKPKFEYEPHRANTVVFEDSPEEIRARKSKSKSSSKFQIFSKKLGQKKPLYTHNTASDDSLELAPTIAMGYENSMDKQIKKMHMTSELRITGDGWYYEPGEEIEEEQVQRKESTSSLRALYETSPKYDRGRSQSRGRGGNSSREASMLMPPSQVARSRSVSRERAPSPYRSQVVSRQASVERARSISRKRVVSAPMMETVSPLDQEEMENNVVSPVTVETSPHKKQGVLKKLFSSSEKSRLKQRVKRDKLWTNDQRDTLYVDPTQIPTPPQSLHIDTHQYYESPRHSQPSSPLQDRFSPREPEPAATPGPTLVDILNSIPIVSPIFHRIDENTALSDQSKLLIKLGIVVLILYEIQSCLEAIGAVSSSS